MGWFTRKPPPEPLGDPRAGRLGPEPALAPTRETPGVALAPLAEAPTCAALFGVTGSAGELAVKEALGGAPAGAPVPGISGLRVLRREGAVLLLRLGPPPGARWALRGVSALALFSGKLLLVDGEEGVSVRGGTLVTVARPGATLYLEAGHDSALALALADARFAATLG